MSKWKEAEEKVFRAIVHHRNAMQLIVEALREWLQLAGDDKSKNGEVYWVTKGEIKKKDTGSIRPSLDKIAQEAHEKM